MDVETFARREKMLQLRENLLAVEEDRAAGRKGCTIDELDAFLAESTANKIGQLQNGVDRFAFQRSFVIRNL